MSFELSRSLPVSADALLTTPNVPVLDKASLTSALLGQDRSSTSLRFGSVSDYGQLVAGTAPGIEVHVLDPAQDAVTQITSVLLGRQGITSLHIVSQSNINEPKQAGKTQSTP